jgi:hypothetical protein
MRHPRTLWRKSSLPLNSWWPLRTRGSGKPGLLKMRYRQLTAWRYHVSNVRVPYGVTDGIDAFLSLSSPFVRMLLPSLGFFHITSPASSTVLLISSFLISSCTPCNCLNIRRQQNGLQRIRTFHRNQISGLRSRMCWRETARHSYALATIRSTHRDLRSETREPILHRQPNQLSGWLAGWLADWATIPSPLHFPRLPSVSIRTCAFIHSQHCK